MKKVKTRAQIHSELSNQERITLNHLVGVWKLSLQQRQIFMMLLGNEIVRVNDINNNVQAWQAFQDERSDQSIRVSITHMNKKLDPFGYKVSNRFGQGFFIDPMMKAEILNGKAYYKNG